MKVDKETLLKWKSYFEKFPNQSVAIQWVGQEDLDAVFRRKSEGVITAYLRLYALDEDNQMSPLPDGSGSYDTRSIFVLPIEVTDAELQRHEQKEA